MRISSESPEFAQPIHYRFEKWPESLLSAHVKNVTARVDSLPEKSTVRAVSRITGFFRCLLPLEAIRDYVEVNR
jgi:hypothetical protein